MKKSIDTIYVRDVLVAFLGVLVTFSCLIQRVFSLDAYFKLRWFFAVLILFITITSLLIYSKASVSYNRIPFSGLIIFLLSSLISSYLNRAGYMLHVGIFSALMIFDIYLVCLLSYKIGNIRLLCKSIFMCLCIVCMLNDILCLISENFYGNGRFLLYSKFYASYLHIILVTLYGYLYEDSAKPRMRFYVLIGACIVIVNYLDCNTAVVGLLVIAFLSICPNAVTKKIMNPKFVIISILVLGSVLIAIDSIFESPLFRWILTDIFGESTDLNSRRYIYESMGNIFQVKPFFGFGAENNFAACQQYIRLNQYEAAPDVQNGLLDWVVSYGIIGTLLALTFLYTSFKSVFTNQKRCSFCRLRSVKWPTFLLYAFFLMGSVEIAFDILFFFSVILFLYIGQCGNSRQETELPHDYQKRRKYIHA